MSNRLNHTIITHHHHHHLRRLRMRRRRKGRSRVPSVDIFRWFISIQWRLIYEGTLPMMISKSRPGRGKGSRRRGRCRRLYLSNSLRSHDIVRRARFLWSIEYINQRRLIRFILRIIGLFFVHCFVGCGFRGQISLFVYFFWSLLRAWRKSSSSAHRRERARSRCILRKYSIFESISVCIFETCMLSVHFFARSRVVVVVVVYFAYVVEWFLCIYKMN